MPPDPNQLQQFVQNIPPDQLDHIHEALYAIRVGQHQGQPLDTSHVDQDKLSTLWNAVHSRVQEREQKFGDNASPEPSLGERASALGAKFVGALNLFPQGPTIHRDPMTGKVNVVEPSHPDQPVLDIQKLETPGYAQEHPFMHGLAGGASAMLTPSSIGLQLTGLGEGKAALWAGRAFTAMLAKGNYEQAKAFKAAVDKGDKQAVWTAAGEFAATAPFTLLGAAGEVANLRKPPGSTPAPIVEPEAPQGPRTPTPRPPLAEQGYYRRVLAPNETTSRATPTSEIAGKLWEGIQQPEAPTQTITPELHADFEKIAGGPLTKDEAEVLHRKLTEERLQPGKADETTAIREERRSQLEKPDPNRYAGEERRAQPPAVAPEQRAAEITDRLVEGAKGTKTPEEKVAWAQERAGLMAEKAKIAPGAKEPEGPLQQIQRAVLRTVTPDANPKSPSRAERSADLTKLVDQHVASGAISAKDLNDQADAAENRAKAIQYHLDVQGAKRDLQAARREAGVDRIRVSQYAEPGEQVADTEAGEKPAGSRMQFVDQATTARRTVLDMLGGYNLTAKRLYDAETGRVERNFKTQPLTPEESKFAMEHQAALSEAVKKAQATKAMPDEATLQEMEGHVTAIEAATGMKMVYSGKGSSLEGFDPSMSALNELIGRGAKSKLAKPLDRAGVIRDRLNDAADLFRTHADRLGGIAEDQDKLYQMEVEALDPTEAARSAAKKLGIEYHGVQEGIPGKIADVHIFQDPKSGTSIGVEADQWSEGELGRRHDAARLRMGTPVETPTTTPAVPEPEAALDHATQIRPILADRIEQIEERMAGSHWDEVPAEQKQLLERAKGWMEKAMDDPEAYEKLPGSMRKEIEKAARNGEAGAIRASMLGGGLGVRLRDWFDYNREDETTVAGKLQNVADRMKMALARLPSHFGKFAAAVKGQQAYGDFDKVTGDFDLHMQQTAQIREEFAKGLKQLVPQKIRRIGITNYLEAGGDPAVLAQREAGAARRYKRGYQVAQQLTPLEKAAADSLRQSYDDLAQRAVNAGVLHSFVEDYVNHVYKQLPSVVGRTLTSISNGTLRSNPRFAMRRVWDSFYEAEQQGAIPQKDIAILHDHYVDALERAIASRSYVKAGTESLEADGRKTFSVSGSAQRVGEVDQDPALLVRPQGSGPNSEEDTSDYRSVNHSSMRQWQWVSKDPETGQNVFMQGELKVHPDRYAQVKSMLESSKLRDFAVARVALRITAGIKDIIFLGTGFHPLTLTFHGAERGAAAGMLDKVDVQNNQIQQIGVSHGLKLHDYDAAYTMGKTLEETFLGKAAEKLGVDLPQGVKSAPSFGRWLQSYQHWVFNVLQPRLKVTAFRMGLEANLRTYDGKLTHDQIAAKTALEVNNAFGGQNWQRMGVSKTAQDILKLGFMAPDFLKSRMAYTAQSFRPDTHLEQTKSMWLRGGLAMYMGARILNHILNNGDSKWDPRDAFTVYHGGQKYTLRTAQQDFVGLLQNPHSFMTARVAPLGQTAVEAYTGRNEQGFERNAKQQVQDFLARTPQLTVQQYLNSPDASWWDSFRSSMGIHVKEAHTPAEDLALQYRAGNIPRGAQYDEERERFKTLRSARRMAARGQMDEMGKALEQGMEGGKISAEDAKNLYLNMGKAFLPQVMRGLSASQMLDVYRKASPDERTQIGPQVYRSYLKAMTDPHVAASVRTRVAKEADELFK